MDRHKISQVLRTLILCCFKATPAGGNVHITLSFVKKDRRELAQVNSQSQGQTPSNSKKAAKDKERAKEKAREGRGVYGGLMGMLGRTRKAGLIGGASSRSKHSRRSHSEEEQAEAAEWLVMEVHDTGKSLHRREVRGEWRLMVDDIDG